MVPQSQTQTSDEVVLELNSVTKRFPGVIANDSISFDLRRGEIHCLLGENGAGKSTLMNVVFGLYRPDEGTIAVHGTETHFHSSRDAIAAGIGMVHQHFKLIPVMTVAENVMLGTEPRRGVLIDLASVRAKILALSKQYGLAVDPDATVGDLSVGAQQRVELIKALYREADILILDEPTAVLTPGEVDDFFDVVRSLVEQGRSIVFITHKLREVLAVADRVTVLRRGKVVGTADPKTATRASLATLMVGREVVLEIDKGPASPGDVVLSVRQLNVGDDRGLDAVRGTTFDVRAGEIVGVAGVEGNGQRELIQAIAGMRPSQSGEIDLHGKSLVGRTPRQVTRAGVAHVPEDRGKHGMISSLSVADNAVLNRYNLAPFAKGWRRQAEPRDAEARRLVELFDVRTPGVDVAMSSLSGGNQQKVIVARELASDSKLLIVAQPTRGLDVGSIEFIHTQIVAARDAGAAVLLVSAELDEILALADRIVVLYRGAVADTIDRGEATRERLGLLMAGESPSTGSGRTAGESPS